MITLNGFAGTILRKEIIFINEQNVYTTFFFNAIIHIHEKHRSLMLQYTVKSFAGYQMNSGEK